MCLRLCGFSSLALYFTHWKRSLSGHGYVDFCLLELEWRINAVWTLCKLHKISSRFIITGCWNELRKSFVEFCSCWMSITSLDLFVDQCNFSWSYLVIFVFCHFIDACDTHIWRNKLLSPCCFWCPYSFSPLAELFVD